MADDTHHLNSIPINQLTPEEANRIIHTHRKVRYGTACWPCRQRKVKCSGNQPCENCIKRDHAELCSYKPARAAKKSSSADPASPTSRKRPYSSDDHGAPLKREPSGNTPRPQSALRAYDDAEAPEVSRYVGQNSIPALLRHQSSEDNDGRRGEVDSIRHDMHSILGLDNSAPFPLMSSNHLERLSQEILGELPADREVMNLFRTYKELPQKFWGIVLDIDDLESRLMVYLEDRARASRSKTPVRPVSASWLAILFAVLAVGCQYHDSPYHVRTTTSQKYLQISFHFLRLGNFLLRPTLDSLQALLLISFCLLNDMKAEASWALLGMTCRLAFSLGLHKASAVTPTTTEARAKDLDRRKVWWGCVWHDTLTSLSFDRYPMTNVPCCPIPFRPDAELQGWTYLESMYELNDVISRRLNPDSMTEATHSQILEICEETEAIRGRVAPQIRTKANCRSAIDCLQHYAIRLHTAFVMSVCCRPALRHDNTNLTQAERKSLIKICQEHLTETVRMFLAMHQLSVVPTRSWAFTYHGLSSALLLGLLPQSKADPETRRLQGDLIAALTVTTAKDESAPVHVRKTDKDIELSGPLSRALVALKNIYNHGTVAPIAGTRSGTRTPMSVGQLAGTVPAPDPMDKTTGQGPTNLDPHQHAALAMTEMQNGLVSPNANLQPFATGNAMPNMNPQDLAGIDPSMYTQPMQLYDSIFWDSPDTWNPAIGDLNLDFLAQPPQPGQSSQQQFYF